MQQTYGPDQSGTRVACRHRQWLSTQRRNPDNENGEGQEATCLDPSRLCAPDDPVCTNTQPLDTEYAVRVVVREVSARTSRELHADAAVRGRGNAFDL
jgi:hypothetical protein